MAYTQNDLETIERAIATGERVVQFAERRIEYRSIDELIRARDQIQQSLQSKKTFFAGKTYRAMYGGKGL